MAEIIAVSALNKYVRSILESDSNLESIAISGEIRNFNRNSKTGHCYFSLGDDKATVRAVMFRSSAQMLAFSPVNGMSVVVRGKITLYEKDGAFQIYVEYMFEEGVGRAQLAFEALKQKLEQEGLFEQERKKALPDFPRRIGLITSKTGAVLHDILTVAQKRCPTARFALLPTRVQGAAASKEVVAAIKALNEMDDIDLIIVARGGGSAEDLSVFNDETLVRAAAHCQKPLVSAIGHETDFCLLDFVADLRAPTPSAAAELVLPDTMYLMRTAVSFYQNISNNVHMRLNSCYNRVKDFKEHISLFSPQKKVTQCELQLKMHIQSVKKETQNTLRHSEHTLRSLAALAASVNPYELLARGYSIVNTEGNVLKSATQVEVGGHVQVCLVDGKVDCVVENIAMERVKDD